MDQRGTGLSSTVTADTLARQVQRRVLAETVIDELVVPGHPGRIDPEARIEGLDFVRPVYRQGQVVLTLRPIGPGLFTPFERPRTAGALRPSI